MARTHKREYPQSTPALIDTLREALNAFIAGETTRALAALVKELPQGSITEAWLDEDSGLINFAIKDRKARLIEPEGFLIVRLLSLLEAGAVIIDKSSTDEKERKDYVEMFGDQGLTLQRLLSDAQQGETVRFLGDHHDLSARNLSVIRGRNINVRGRREAIAAALEAYDKNAKKWGLAAYLSRWQYQQMLRHAFRLYDIRYGHSHLKAI